MSEKRAKRTESAASGSLDAPHAAAVPAGFFMLRTPVLPVDVLSEWSAVGADLSFDERVRAQRAALRAIVDRPEVREALRVASPSVFARLGAWMDDPLGREGRKLEPVLVRYVTRMAARAAPFGMFAGVGWGELGSATSLVALAEPRRRARVDQDALRHVTRALSADKAAGDGVTFRPNRSLYDVDGERMRYLRTVVSDGKPRYELVGVERDEALACALEAARGGRTRAAIAHAIAAHLETDADEARAYVDGLVDAELLETVLTPPLTGANALDVLAVETKSMPDLHARFESLRASVRELDGSDLGRRWGAAAEALEAELAGYGVTGHALDVTLTTGAAGTLSLDDATALALGAELLHRTVEARDPFRDFRGAFVARFGRERVPLMAALDETDGVGFADPREPPREPPGSILEGFGDRRRVRSAGARWTRWSRFLLGELEAVWSAGATTLELDPAKVAAVVGRTPDAQPMPESFAAFASVIGEGGERRFLLHSFLGQSAARLLGRFASLDEHAAARLRAHLREEEDAHPAAIFAEIVHFPASGRGANVVTRPALRDWEIAFAGRGAADEAHTLTLADLFVTVREGRVILSTREGREVVPRLSVAHNYASGQVAAYRFLGTFQEDGVVDGAGWSWGAFAAARFLPRVTAGRVLLSPAEWGLAAAEIASLARPTLHERCEAMSALRAARRLPALVGLREGENVLPFDLDLPLSVDAFIDALRGESSARVVESFHGRESAAARGPSGRHVAEVVVPFMRARSTRRGLAGTEPAAPAPERVRPASPPAGARRAPAEGEGKSPAEHGRAETRALDWCVAHVRVPPSSLSRAVLALAASAHLTSARDGKRWLYEVDASAESPLTFAVRGRDVRAPTLSAIEAALGALAGSRASWFATFAAPDVKSGAVRSAFALDLAAVDSAWSARALGLAAGALPDWAVVLASWEGWLGAFGLSTERRVSWAEALLARRTRELGLADAFRHAAAARYRERRAEVDAVLSGESLSADLRVALAERATAAVPLIERARAAMREDAREASLDATLRGTASRLVFRRQALHEALLAVLALKHYQSRAARARGRAPR